VLNVEAAAAAANNQDLMGLPAEVIAAVVEDRNKVRLGAGLGVGVARAGGRGWGWGLQGGWQGGCRFRQGG
jgi:hypothetical protein